MKKITSILQENNIFQNEEIEIINYGLFLLKSLVINIFTTLILGFIFGLVIESMVFLLAFSSLRSYAGGYHAKTPVKCYVFSTITVAFWLMFVSLVPSEYMLYIGSFFLVLSIPVILKIAPIETPSKPLDSIEKKHYRKKTLIVLSFELAIVVFLFLINFNTYAFVVCLAIFLVSVVVLMQKISEQSKIKKNNI